MMKRHAPEIFSDEIVNAYFSGGRKRASRPKKKPFLKITLSGWVTVLSLFFIISLLALKIAPYRYIGRKSDTLPSRALFNKLIEGGAINRQYVKKLSFDGDARKNSVLLKNSILLVNKGDLNWASLNIELNGAVDFRNSFLFIDGKTTSGIKHMNLILVDSTNNTYGVPKILFSPKGKMNNVPLQDLSNADINPEKIVRMRLEFGTATAGNAQGTKFYIKDLYLRKHL